MTKTERADRLNELVEIVKRHAETHYEESGWDIVVECWSDDEIRRTLGRSTTPRGAIRTIRSAIAPSAERRSEIRSLAF